MSNPIEMKELPAWLQELWELSPSLARRAEKHYLELTGQSDTAGDGKCKFAIDWTRNSSYGIGSGTEHHIAENAAEALAEFWKGKNKEAYEVGSVYVC